MTVISSSIVAKKDPLIAEVRPNEAVVNIGRAPRRPGPPKQFRAILMFMAVVASLVLMTAMIMALQVYERMVNERRHNRYQGFCSIPLSRDIQMLQQRKAPLRWKSTENTGRIDPDVQVISIMNEEPEHLFDLLREVLDIDIDDSVEKIVVFNNGHPVTFLHDFAANVSGIVDSDRCFSMDLDLSLVLQPEKLLQGLQHGAEFDVSRVRSELRASLPPLAADEMPAALRPHCAALGKPTYALRSAAGTDDGDAAIRKRSVDAPPHDYMQFAGKSVQEIEISNLAELLEYEQKKKSPA